MSKKVVHVAPSFFPDRGGVETHVAQVVGELSNRGCIQTIVTTSPSHSTSSSKNRASINDAVEVVRMPQESLSSKWSVWRWIWSHRELFQKADVIQVHDVGWWLLPLILSGITRGKLFTTFHGWESFPVRWQAKLQRWILSWLSVQTIHIGEWIQEFYWDTPSLISYGGVRLPNHFLVPQKQKMVTKNTKLACVFVGRLEEGNCIGEYLQLFQLLHQHFPDAHITWVGDGSFREECEKLGEVTGMVDDVFSYLGTADIAFCNSYLSLWECVASGSLTVSLYQHRLKRRYLETFPLASDLLIAANAYSAADQLVKLLTMKDSSLQQRKTEQQARARQYSWSTVADSYEQLWSTP